MRLLAIVYTLSLGLVVGLEVDRSLAADGSHSASSAPTQITGNEANYLISQIESALNEGQKTRTLQDPELLKVELRLADLKADRARQNEVLYRQCLDLSSSEPSQQPDTCSEKQKLKKLSTQVQQDRTEAYRLYDQIQTRIHQSINRSALYRGPKRSAGAENDKLREQINERSRILLKMAQMNESFNRYQLARKQYLKVAQTRYGAIAFPEAHRAIAWTAMGEMSLRNRKFKTAEDEFGSALKLREVPRRGWVMSRLAWTHLSQGHSKPARIEFQKILVSDDLLRLDGNSVDEGFKSEVAEDLGMLYAAYGCSLSEMKNLWELTPVSNRTRLFLAVGEEANRIGQPKRAIMFLGHLGAQPLKHQNDSATQFLAVVRMAQASWISRDMAGTRDHIEIASKWLAKGACEPYEQCVEGKKHLQSLVLDWVRLEETEKQFSAELNQTLSSLVQSGTDQIDLLVWIQKVQLGRVQPKGPDVALKAVRALAQAVIRAVNQLPENDPQYSTRQDVLEASLLMVVDAELKAKTKPTETLKSIDSYLNHSITQSRTHELTLEKGRKLIELNRRKEAYSALRDVAFDQEKCSPGKSTRKVCLEAGHLATDQLRVLGQTRDLSELASELFRQFAESEFGLLHVRTTLIMAKASLKPKAKILDLSPKEALKAIETLEDLKLKDLPQDLEIDLANTWFALALERKEEESARRALAKIRAIRPRSEQRIIAQRELEYAKEFGDQSQLYDALKKVFDLQSKGPGVQDWLALAALARDIEKEKEGGSQSLWRQRHIQHLRKAMKMSGLKKSDRAQIALSLVQLETNPVKTLQEFKRDLTFQMEQFASALLDVWSKSPSRSSQLMIRAQLETYPKIRSGPIGQILIREWSIAQRQNVVQQIEKTLESNKALTELNSQQLASELERRLAQIRKLEREASSFAKANDAYFGWIAAQAVSLLNRSLYYDIRHLQPNVKMNRSESRVFKAQLAKRAHPYLVKSLKADAVADRLKRSGVNLQRYRAQIDRLRDSQNMPWRDPVLNRQEELLEKAYQSLGDRRALGSTSDLKIKRRGT